MIQLTLSFESRVQSPETRAKPPSGSGLSALDARLLKAAEARARKRMEIPAPENPTRAEIEADLRRLALDRVQS